MRRNNMGPFPIIFFFLVFSALFLTAKGFLDRNGFDQSVLFVGNLVIFLATVLSFLFARRGLTVKNPHAFVRSVYLSIMVKLFVCVVAALIYIFLFRNNLNRPALFTCMGLYLVYTLIEVSVLTKMLKEKKNA
jgi:hypothetical protein